MAQKRTNNALILMICLLVVMSNNVNLSNAKESDCVKKCVPTCMKQVNKATKESCDSACLTTGLTVSPQSIPVDQHHHQQDELYIFQKIYQSAFCV
ncbi:hypothetical protein LIER_39365 [Lithospermum erythrorhizon]|uniref:Plant thionin family protein n=1 Tax=Lithospermum erythrorhizon TaxID=34254 RepID=A0AAV3QGS3_LITER